MSISVLGTDHRRSALFTISP